MLSGRGARSRADRARLAVAAALAVACLAFPAAAAAADEGRPPQVLVVQSYHRGFTWDDEQMEGLLAGFRAR